MTDNDYTNKATVKVVRQQLHEINDITAKYNRLAKEHVDLVNKYSDLSLLYKQSKGENKKLKVLLQVATEEIKRYQKARELRTLAMREAEDDEQ